MLLVLVAGALLTSGVWGAEPDRPPLLCSPQVVPYNLNDRASYKFRVRYTSPDRSLPKTISVFVDGKEMVLTAKSRKSAYDAWYESQKIKLDVGHHKYYFYCEDGRGLAFRSPRYGEWDGPYVGRSWRKSYNTYPELTDGHLVQGDAGDVETFFTYSVHFSDYDSTAPKKIWAVIDGLKNPMKLHKGLPWNGTYIYNTWHDTLSHAFYFVTEDAKGAKVSYPTEGFIRGPAVADIPNTSPELTDAKVHPIIGGKGKPYRFQVRYWDAEKDPPTIIQVVVDNFPHNMTLEHGTRYNGWYYAKVKLPVSSYHTYYFRAEDGRGGETTEPLQGIEHGPVVVDQ